MNEGKFIVFEGIDGAGTTTQVALLHEFLLKNNYKSVKTCEPSDGPIGNLIRQALNKRILFNFNKSIFDEQMGFLFAADRHDHLYNPINGIFKFLEEGIHVICDRYYFSSIAYQGTNGKNREFIAKLNENFIEPDLVFYLDNSVEISMCRMQHRSFLDVYETSEKLRHVKSCYDAIFLKYPGPFVRIRADDTIKKIHEHVIYNLENSFPQIF